MSEHKPSYRITDLAASERPRERLEKHGPGHLSVAELLAILLPVGVEGENAVQMAHRLLNEFGGLTGLHRATFEEVVSLHGLGPAKAAQIKAALELENRLRLETPDERPSIHSPADAAALVQFEMSVLEQEELHVILLDNRNRVLKIERVYRGSVNTSQVRVGELFKAAVRSNAPALIVVHNHPSGDPTPSPVIWRICQGYWPNSATGSQRSGAKRLSRNRFTRAIIFPPVTLSRVLRCAQHPSGTSPLTGARPAGRLSA